MNALADTGRVFTLAAQVVRLSFRRPVQVRETVEQFWFIASVTILPAALVSIPFGAVIAHSRISKLRPLANSAIARRSVAVRSWVIATIGPASIASRIRCGLMARSASRDGARSTAVSWHDEHSSL